METTRIIEQYLDGTLGFEERRTLEERIAADRDLRNLIALHKEVDESIRDKDLSELKALIEKISAEHSSKEKPQIKNRRIFKTSGWQNYVIRVAAILFVVAGAVCVLRYALLRDSNAQRLYQKYYTVYDADGISRSAQSDRQLFDNAIINYTQKDFAGALDKLNSIVQSEKDNHLAWFFRGLAFLETGAAAEAIQSFTAIPAAWSNPYSEHRDWYLALAYLRNGDMMEATEGFTRISVAKGYYAEKANKILRKLKP